MAKFLKSIFNSTERRKSSVEDEEEVERTETPPMDGRRQLSISRSGRMRQANKKRNSLTLELYGDTIDIDSIKRHTPVEYHVHGPTSQTAPAALSRTDNRLNDDSDIEIIDTDVIQIERTFDVHLQKQLNTRAVEITNKSPEEEIDNAFEIIDKS